MLGGFSRLRRTATSGAARCPVELRRRPPSGAPRSATTRDPAASSATHVGDADEGPEATAHARQVGRVGALGDDTDEAVQRDELEDGGGAAGGLEDDDRWRRDGQLGKPCSAPLERLRQQEPAAEPGQVADHEGGRTDGTAATDVLGGGAADHPGHHDLAIEDGARQIEATQRGDEVGESIGDIVATDRQSDVPALGTRRGCAARPRSGRPRRSSSMVSCRADLESIGRRSSGGSGSRASSSSDRWPAGVGTEAGYDQPRSAAVADAGPPSPPGPPSRR